MHARQVITIDQLTEVENLYPAFDATAFTTAEFTFGNSPNDWTRNTYDEFGSVRIVTTLGEYGPYSSWLMYWHEEEGDRMVIYCPPGTTVLIPGSVVRWGFTALKKGDTRYTFQQYFNAAVGRWVDQGFRSDADFAKKATAEEWNLYEDARFERVESRMRLFSKLEELFV
ncbi:hypothetical protein DFH07DRAFT_751443 [Mycena maculata]|uniref:Uncharacterized protein n=1 Tax=Mycena maculata TaxID=230809 RepID=A0AAD7IE98_9AGAR|nr:hypothetical protein DFH07DRAFT_751443 [Mycena maculata]